jgi:hypothetical protein
MAQRQPQVLSEARVQELIGFIQGTGPRVVDALKSEELLSLLSQYTPLPAPQPAEAYTVPVHHLGALKPLMGPLTAAQLEELPTGSVLRTSYGHSILTDSDKFNSQTTVEDTAPVYFLLPPDSYTSHPFLQSEEELPAAGWVLLYTDGEPDAFITVATVRRYPFPGSAALRVLHTTAPVSPTPAAD